MSRREIRDFYRSFTSDMWLEEFNNQEIWLEAAQAAVPGGTPEVNFGRLIASTYPEMPSRLVQVMAYHLADYKDMRDFRDSL